MRYLKYYEIDESIPVDLDLRAISTFTPKQLEHLAFIFEELATLSRAVKTKHELDAATERGEPVQDYEHEAVNKKLGRTIARLPSWVML